MQWHVHGTDAVTGRPVTLAVEHAEAMGAVQSAMSKRILVSYVIGGGRQRIRALAFPTLCAAAVVLAVACGFLYWRGENAREQLVTAAAQADRLNASIAQSEGTIAGLQERIAALDKAESGAGRELADQLEKARQRGSSLEKDLAEARTTLVALEKTARAAGEWQSQAVATRVSLQAAESRAAQLEKQKKALDAQVAAAAGKVKLNKELAAEVELLKSQLLVQVAQSEAPAPSAPPPVETPSVPRAMRWGLRTSYDEAADFMALHFSREGMTTSPGPQGTMAESAMSPANAATMRVVHDLEKQRVYAATLTLPLAPDGPKDNVAENVRLVGAFVRAFAPRFNDPDAWAAEAVKLLAGKDSAQRLVHVGEDYKLTVWNNQQGGYSWRIDSPRGEIE